MIEKAYIDIDSVDGPQGQSVVTAWLRIEGDFHSEFSHYLNDENQSGVSLSIDRSVATELIYELERIVRP